MKSTLTNEQLIAKAKQWVKELCESGGRKWSLRVPVDFNHDPDVIFIELCNRLEEYAQQQPGPRWVLEEIDFLEDCIKVTKEGGWSTHLVKPMQDRIEKLKNAYPQSFSVVLSGEGMSATNLKNG